MLYLCVNDHRDINALYIFKIEARGKAGRGKVGRGLEERRREREEVEEVEEVEESEITVVVIPKNYHHVNDN